eukprot:CAMPEP_0168740388 /NCGR_PEP_ID=MMETSP0724-20121128/11958_1 /TAXON_ID=265536 /ORGANISM="Amphiprora sp., Strain CCMP467" /LENGTH=747 /DNA_ID=CAMNT_0008787831 /DNA_START=69 /DNA_END=2310 /DNA_ORIENTATION=+
MSASSFGNSSSSNMIQHHLVSALEEVERREQVQSCLSDMITNIEWAEQCNQQVEAKRTREALAKALTDQVWVLEETALVKQDDDAQRRELATNLIKEMYKISQDLGELYQLRQEHQELSQNFDELVAKLLQAEERIEFMKEGGGGGSGAETNSNAEVTNNNNKNTDAQDPTSPADGVTKDNDDTDNHPENQSTTTGATDEEETKVMSSTAPPVPNLDDDDDDDGHGKDLVPSLIRPKAAASAATATAAFTSSGEITLDMVEGGDVDEKEETIKEPETSDTSTQQQQEQQQQEVATTMTTATEPASSSAATSNDPTPTTASLEPTEPSPPAASAAATAAAAVVMVEQDDEEAPRLETLETQILMHVFGYLDALDILNTAQVNISMYSRVDGMEGDNSTIATYDSNVPDAQAPFAPNSTAPAATTTNTTQSAPSSNAAAKAPPPAAVAHAPTIVRPPPPLELTPQQQQQTTQVAATAAAAPAAASGTRTPIQGLERTIFGFLQPRKSPQLTSTPIAATSSAPTPQMGNTPTSSARRSPRPQPEAAPMNAAMANSMASKLSDAELTAIIQMTERLRRKEAQLDQLHNENERLAAELDGTDAVKQFLVAKVRSMEESLRQTEDQEAKVAQQIASDQEVIAFLDGRVQELEQSLANSRMETESLQVQWSTYQTQAEQKATVLTDMLRFERERVQETQSEFKMLVKEVKSCRAQIMALTAESRALSQENDSLKRALLHSNTPASPGRPSYSKR